MPERIFNPHRYIDSGSIAYLGEGTGAQYRTSKEKLDDWISVKDFGAVGDGLTDDTISMQNAIDAAEAYAVASPVNGPVIVFCPAGQYLIGQITLKDRVFIKGDGPQATFFKAKNNLNDHLFISDGFSTLTGQNKWLNADGVLSYIGFSNCNIDGNKANQTAGDGVRLYAKGLFFDNVIIRDCKGNGLYTETGESGSVATWPSYPEGRIGLLYLGSNDGHGWHMRGPHDIYCDKVVSLLNGDDGVRVESSSGVYLATPDFNFLHCYANTGYGLNVIDSSFRASLLRVENSEKEGLIFTNADHCQINIAHIFDNAKTSGTYQAVINSTSQYNTIANLLIRRAGRAAAGGLQISGTNNNVTGVIRGDVTGGGNSTGIGLDIPSGANYSNINIVVYDFSGVGATAFRTGQGGAINWCQVTATLQNSTTLWNNVTAGTNNQYRISGNTTSGATKFTGVGPNTESNKEFWSVCLRDATPSLVLSSTKVQSSSTVDLNSTTEQSFTIPHSLLVAPAIDDVQLSVSYSGANTTWAIQYLKVTSVDATNVTCAIKLSTAAGVAHTGRILMRVEL